MLVLKSSELAGKCWILGWRWCYVLVLKSSELAGKCWSMGCRRCSMLVLKSSELAGKCWSMGWRWCLEPTPCFIQLYSLCILNAIMPVSPSLPLGKTGRK